MRSIRSQADDVQDDVSLQSGLSCEGSVDTARQEFLEETDVHYVLSRYGVGSWQARQPSFGDTDWDIDLHTAYIARRAANNAFRLLSPALQERFQGPEGMLDAMNSGELDKLLREELEAAERPSSAIAGHPPESAPSGDVPPPEVS